jgi:hypothetical protein
LPSSLGKTGKEAFSRKTTRKRPEKGGSKIPIIIRFAEVHRYLEKPPAKGFPVWKRVFLGLREVAEVDLLCQRSAT